MTALTIILEREGFIDILTIVITLVTLIAVLRSKINPSWLILAGGLLGWLKFFFF